MFSSSFLLFLLFSFFVLLFLTFSLFCFLFLVFPFSPMFLIRFRTNFANITNYLSSICNVYCDWTFIKRHSKILKRSWINTKRGMELTSDQSQQRVLPIHPNEMADVRKLMMMMFNSCRPIYNVVDDSFHWTIHLPLHSIAHSFMSFIRSSIYILNNSNFFNIQ